MKLLCLIECVIFADVRLYFIKQLEKNPDTCAALPAVETLLYYLKCDNSETLAGMMARMKRLIAVISTCDRSNASVISGLELFLRFITLASLERPELCESRRVMIARAEHFLRRYSLSRRTVSLLAQPFIVDSMTVLTHSRSRVVRDALILAQQSGKKFTVLITESQPDCSGRLMCRELREAGVQCSVVLDAAVASVLETVDCVMVGAEAVAENGGIFNKIGTFSLSLCAVSFKIPVYVLVESLKFTRIYPLSQTEVPDRFKFTSEDSSQAVVDFTPSRHLRLLFTDLGILTPAAVSDELLQLYT